MDPLSDTDTKRIEDRSRTVAVNGSGRRPHPHLPLLPDDAIENIANIHFDFNPPVITEPSVLVAEFTTGVVALDAPTLVLASVPTHDRSTIRASARIETVAVLSADGRVVRMERIQSDHALVELTSLPSGRYILQAGFDHGSNVRRPFILIHP